MENIKKNSTANKDRFIKNGAAGFSILNVREKFSLSVFEADDESLRLYGVGYIHLMGSSLVVHAYVDEITEEGIFYSKKILGNVHKGFIEHSAITFFTGERKSDK